MDLVAVKREIDSHLVRQGLLEKYSRFLKELRSRWVVLTSNYLMTFKNRDSIQPTYVLDLKYVKSVKSFFKKSDENSPGFKITSDYISLVFKCTSVPYKWCWIVALERAIEFKQRGATLVNDETMLRKRGLPSVYDYESNLPSPPTFEIIVTHPELYSPTKKPLRNSIQVLYLPETRSKSKSFGSELVDQAMQTEPPEDNSPKFKRGVSKQHKSSFVRPKYTYKKEITNSEFMLGLFDLFYNQSNHDLLHAALNFLIKISNRKYLIQHVLCECKMNGNKETVASMFIDKFMKDITGYNVAFEALSFLALVLDNITDFFTFEQFQQLVIYSLEALKTYKKESTLSMLLRSIEIIHCLHGYTRDQVETIIRLVKQLYKTAKNPAIFEYFFEYFHD